MFKPSGYVTSTKIKKLFLRVKTYEKSMKNLHYFKSLDNDP